MSTSIAKLNALTPYLTVADDPIASTCEEYVRVVSDLIEEPDQGATILRVGQDRDGHWLVQENHGLMEGRFISRAAAWQFARAERHSFPGAALVEAEQPLVAIVSFDPPAPDECVRRAA
ncbi:hypothetical protein [Sphingomonas sp. R1]|uniref:hypothetical protein n=1 Tax=Sphingomonas sp. R1 TaxID=399176 RepID=UPI002224152B|nr:hypothetical protein [Sphingomonas sp. R1]UYY76835.1 hypothetical protein OIM94_15190 [Sphingomonas sp. R1]